MYVHRHGRLWVLPFFVGSLILAPLPASAESNETAAGLSSLDGPMASEESEAASLTFAAAMELAVDEACQSAGAILAEQEGGTFDPRRCQKQFAPLKSHALAGELYVSQQVGQHLQGLVEVEDFWRHNGIASDSWALRTCVDALQSAAYRAQSNFWRRWLLPSDDGTKEPSCQLDYLFPRAGAMFTERWNAMSEAKRRETEAWSIAYFLALQTQR